MFSAKPAKLTGVVAARNVSELLSCFLVIRRGIISIISCPVVITVSVGAAGADTVNDYAYQGAIHSPQGVTSPRSNYAVVPFRVDNQQGPVQKSADQGAVGNGQDGRRIADDAIVTGFCPSNDLGEALTT